MNGDKSAFVVIKDLEQDLAQSNAALDRAVEGLGKINEWRCYHCFEDCPCAYFKGQINETLSAIRAIREGK